MEKVATDIYSFRNLRQAGYTYVDKTAILLPLANDSMGRQFFLARPRRFGKSLLVSTLHSLFEGRRELFKGLAIEPEWNWSKKWTVLHLDMGSCQSALEAYEPDNPQIVTLLYQTGYLTNEGRIDMTCETPAGIWLVEFKLDRPAEEALAQIDERNYAERYDFVGKTVRKLGISFSAEQRTIVDVKQA